MGAELQPPVGTERHHHVDFHGGFTDCGSYGVLCTGGTGTTLTAHPVFYGTLALGLLGTGNSSN